MSRAIRGHGGWSYGDLHAWTGDDWDCPFCESQAEARAEDIEPDYDVEGAENSHERAMGW